jgi:hypothetical protein
MSSASGGLPDSGNNKNEGGLYVPTPPEPTIPDILPEVPQSDPDSPDGNHQSPNAGLPGETPVVPEPGSLTLLSIAVGCGTAGWLRRRQKRNQRIPESVD